ncbi:MAG: tRNA lysidine(34) synthetase TilS [Planctomycetota bacterium]
MTEKANSTSSSLPSDAEAATRRSQLPPGAAESRSSASAPTDRVSTPGERTSDEDVARVEMAPAERPAPAPTNDPWQDRWSRLAHGLGLAPNTPVAVALSGGADSVYLLHLVARAVPRPKVVAIHVDHRLRGDESRADAEFCARLSARLEVPFARRIAEIDPDGPDVEARAREARYRALAEEASLAGISVLLTGHHEDDAVETLLLRWMRGTDLSGLAGLRRETVLGKSHGTDEHGRPFRVLRPLAGMRREEVRSALRREGIDWREDSTNAEGAFTRNRVRHQVLPEIEAQCGTDGVENFFEFARAVESFEDELADRTAHLEWRPVAHEAARRSSATPDLGGTLPREELASLSPPLRRRALGRLVGEGTGRRPTRDVLERLDAEIGSGGTCRVEVHEGWTLQLRADALHLTPPSALLERADAVAATAAPMTGTGLALGVPGTARLADGRTITAEPVTGASRPADDDPTCVEIDATGLGELRVRFERPGDRFHPFGAPGHKPLRRFLGEVGVPREERGRVPLVLDGDEIVWVAGIRTSETRRTDANSVQRVRLTLGGTPAADAR